MKIIIFAGDGLQARRIQDAVDEVIKKERRVSGSRFGHDTYYVAQTKGDSLEEVRIILLSDEKSQKIPLWVEYLGNSIATRLPLDKSQVVCAVKFP